MYRYFTSLVLRHIKIQRTNKKFELRYFSLPLWRLVRWEEVKEPILKERKVETEGKQEISGQDTCMEISLKERE